MSSLLKILSVSLSLLTAPLAWPCEEHEKQAKAGKSAEMPAAQPLNDRSVYQVDGAWERAGGGSIKLSELRGHAVAVTMVFTRCKATCPLTVADLKRIESGLNPGEREKLKLVLVSLDPERDTPAQMAEFAKAHGLDPRRWVLLRGTASSVRRLAAVLGVRYQRNPAGDFDHSNVISILDGDGVIRSQQLGLRASPDESIAKLRQLMKAGTQEASR